jgi:hypothetical protein
MASVERESVQTALVQWESVQMASVERESVQRASAPTALELTESVQGESV